MAFNWSKLAHFLPIPGGTPLNTLGSSWDKLSSLFGGGGNNGNAVVPNDVAGLRQHNIDFLTKMLGNPEQAMSFFYGGPSALATQTRTGISQFLDKPAPETTAFDFARPILEGMLTGTGPQFERDIASANQTGARFGSANAIMRGEAFRNLFNARNQTASTLGTLAASAGKGPFDRLMQGANFAQGDSDRRAQLMAALLGMSGQATLSLPVKPNTSGTDQLLSLLPLLLQMSSAA